MAPLRPIVLSLDARTLDPNVVTVDILARLALAARRLGAELQLQNASGELRELVSFMGLSQALGLEPGWQPEQREQGVGIEEEGELGDPPA